MLVSSFVFLRRTRAAGRLDEDEDRGVEEDKVGDTDGDEDEVRGEDEDRVGDIEEEEEDGEESSLRMGSSLTGGRTEKGEGSLEKSLARSSP